MSDFNKEVWETLSAINVNEHTQDKGGLTYLSWAWAWGVLMEYYPDSQYEFDPPFIYANMTAEVWVTLTVKKGDKEISRKMWLPVMDYRNAAIVEPTARDISDTRMRCLTKALAMFGLGHYIYAGEDLPGNAPAYTQEQFKQYHELLAGEPYYFYVFLQGLSDEIKTDLHNSFEKGKVTAGKKQAAAQEKAGHGEFDRLVSQIREYLVAEDGTGIHELTHDASDGEKKLIFKAFSTDEQNAIRALLKPEAA